MIEIEGKKIGEKIIVEVKEKDLVFKFSKFRTQQYVLKARCDVFYQGKLFLYQHINLESQISIDKFAKLVNDNILMEDIVPAQNLIRRVCEKAVEIYRRGEEFKILENDIEETEFIETKEAEYLLYPFIYKDQANLLYGEGGSFKSFFGLFLAKNLIEKGYKVLFLDYETDEKELKRRTSLLNIPKLFYRYCFLPITEEVDTIASYVLENNIDLVIVDSVGVSISNFNLNEPSSATNLFSAIRQFKTTTLLIGHQPKDTSTDLPFGSVYFYNLARNIWQIQVKQVSQNEIYVLLIHKKDNLGEKKPPQAFRVIKDDFSINFMSTSISNVPDIEEYKFLYQRIYDYLKENPNKTKQEIAKELNESPNKIIKILSKYTKLFEYNEETKTWNIKKPDYPSELVPKIFKMLSQSDGMTTEEIAESLQQPEGVIEKVLNKFFKKKDNKWLPKTKPFE